MFHYYYLQVSTDEYRVTTAFLSIVNMSSNEEGEYTCVMVLNYLGSFVHTISVTGKLPLCG